MPAEVALLIPRAVATQEEAEEAERTAMEAIRGDYGLCDVGQEDREKVDPHTVTDEDLAASVDALTRRLSDMPEWSGNLIDPQSLMSWSRPDGAERRAMTSLKLL